MQISGKTKKIISDFQKSRFYQKNKQEQEQEVYDLHALSQTEIDEIEREKQGLIYREDACGDKRIRVPVRKISLLPLRQNVQVTYSCFNQEKGLLILGDELGFITTYSI